MKLSMKVNGNILCAINQVHFLDSYHEGLRRYPTLRLGDVHFLLPHTSSSTQYLPDLATSVLHPPTAPASCHFMKATGIGNEDVLGWAIDIYVFGP